MLNAKFFAGLMILFFSVISLVVAQPDLVSAINKKANVSLLIPAHAVEVADGVFDLGTETDVDGRKVQGIMFVHRKEGFAKPPWAGGGRGEVKCYSFLANGAKWKTVEPWVVNTVNTEGLTSDFVSSNLAADIDKWEDAVSASTDILGVGTTTAVTLVADTGSPDGSNEVYFGDVGSEGAIAVTIVWYTIGPPSQRQLVEWDQVYDQVDFNWTVNGTSEPTKMDFENIATHELGHSVGLGHPDDSCTEETMYRFADFGETKKRDLHTGDIAGVNALYG